MNTELCIYKSRLLYRGSIVSWYHTDSSFFKEIPGEGQINNGDVVYDAGRAKINTIGKKFLFLKRDSDYIAHLLRCLEEKGHATIQLYENRDFIDELEEIDFSTINCFKSKFGKRAEMIYLLDDVETLILKNARMEKKSINEDLLNLGMQWLKQLPKDKDSEEVKEFFEKLARHLICDSDTLDSVKLLATILSFLSELK